MYECQKMPMALENGADLLLFLYAYSYYMSTMATIIFESSGQENLFDTLGE